MKVMSLKKIYEKTTDKKLKEEMYKLGFQFIDNIHYKTFLKALEILKGLETTEAYIGNLKKRFKGIQWQKILGIMLDFGWISQVKIKNKLYFVWNASTRKVYDILKRWDNEKEKGTSFTNKN